LKCWKEQIPIDEEKVEELASVGCFAEEIASLLTPPGSKRPVDHRGYRSTVDALSPPSRERVRVASIEAVRQEKIREIRADVVYAIARRSPGSVG